MPVYSYRCEGCGRDFELTRSLAETERRPATCPHCGSDRVVWTPAPFVAITGKKS